MPRRTRRNNGSDASARHASNDKAIAARIQGLSKKIMAALHDQRDLRCDLSSTRTRALLLDSEYVLLHAEYERSLAARDKLEGLSRELARQNKKIDEDSEKRMLDEKKMREEIVGRFNTAMMEINKKLARQSSSREQREQYVNNLRSKLNDLNERYDVREQHFYQQMYRKKLEKRLAEAKRRQIEIKHDKVAAELETIRSSFRKVKREHTDLVRRVEDCNKVIDDAEEELDDCDDLYEKQKELTHELTERIKSSQAKNTSFRKQNCATAVHLKSMDVERRRLAKLITEHKDIERKERTKAETLEKQCKQITSERSDLHREILVMQDHWANLKDEIEALKGQDNDGNRVFEVLQNIMKRDASNLSINGCVMDRNTIKEAIRCELGKLRLAAGRNQEENGIGSEGNRATAASSRDVEPPG